LVFAPNPSGGVCNVLQTPSSVWGKRKEKGSEKEEKEKGERGDNRERSNYLVKNPATALKHSRT